jgi:2-methylcitrate dehydratase PrpD
LDPAQVRRVVVSISARNATVLRNHRPETGLAAKFSIEFAVAASLIARRVTLEELTDEFAMRADVQAVFPKVFVEENKEEDPNSGYAPYDNVLVELSDGRTLVSEDVFHAKGAFELPLSREELFEKFNACVRVAGFPLDARTLFDALYFIDKQTSLKSVPGLAGN